MSDVNHEFVERYQILYDRDPKSKVFAPLAEAYRKMGLNNKAYSICLAGVKHHPNFAGGRIALARCLEALDEPEKAAEQLQMATELSPENILAYNLLADLYLKLKEPKKALKAYKMLLFLNPESQKAKKAVKKLESLTADEFVEDVFKMNKIGKPIKTYFVDGPENKDDKPQLYSELERYISLADAFIIRNDLDKAKSLLNEAESKLGQHPDITKRLKLTQQSIDEQLDDEPQQISPLEEARHDQFRKKQKLLQDLLYKISQRRYQD